MHPTAKSAAFIRKTWMLDMLCERRVKPGVRPVSSAPQLLCIESALCVRRFRHIEDLRLTKTALALSGKES